MLTTSAAIPLAASWHLDSGPAAAIEPRDGPGTVAGGGAGRSRRHHRQGRPVQRRSRPGGADARRGSRSAAGSAHAGIPIAVISNQSGIGRGLLDRREVDAVNERIEELLGPFDAWLVCPHTDADGCDCRKPMPGLVRQAAAGSACRPRTAS